MLFHVKFIKVEGFEFNHIQIYNLQKIMGPGGSQEP